jgi:hypothetical protein
MDDVKKQFIAEFGTYLDEVPDEASNQRHWLIGYALEFFKARLKDLYASLGNDKAAVEDTVRAAYRKYLAPIDIPGVPNFVVEPMVDKALEDALVALVLSGFEPA